MHTHNSLRRPAALSAATLIALAMFSPALAQNATQASFELRPYCSTLEQEETGGGSTADGGGFAGDIPDIPGIINPDMNTGGNAAAGGDPSDCRSYDVQSPSMLKTPILRQGDVLDMHLVLNNPQKLAVSRLRAWLVYDPSVLRGDLIEFGAKLPVPTPGEAEFATQEGYAKIGASAASGQEPTSDPLVVAHVKFTVLATPYGSTVISFYDAQGTAEGHTFAMNNAGGEHDILTSTLPSLLVQLDQTAGQPPLVSSAASSTSTVSVTSSAASSVEAASSAATSEITTSSSLEAASVSSAATSEAISSSPPAPSPTFSLLQPQNLRVTTDGGAVYLAWDPLPSSELVGYNIYYGTISGNYLQKRSVDRSATNLTLRGLPEGQTYYFALRGDNGRNEETQFGQEVAVTIGNPSTSTAPLSASVFTTPGPQGRPPATGGQIGGNTGIPSALVLFFIVSAVTGTLLAFRRQWTARTHG